MTYNIVLKSGFEDDLKLHLRSGNKKLVIKVSQFMDELKVHPRTGTGKPEQLKGQQTAEVWSRRIDSKHRLVYEIQEQNLIVIAISAYGHYGEK